MYLVTKIEVIRDMIVAMNSSRYPSSGITISTFSVMIASVELISEVTCTTLPDTICWESMNAKIIETMPPNIFCVYVVTCRE